MDHDAAGLDVSAGFVDRVIDRVLADRAQIEREAARVDEFVLPRGLLDAYASPPVSADFVARTVDMLAAGAQASERDLEASLRRALNTYSAPPVSADFIDRTLAALRLDGRSALAEVVSARSADSPRDSELVTSRGDTLQPRSPRQARSVRRSDPAHTHPRAGGSDRATHSRDVDPADARRKRTRTWLAAVAATLLLALLVWRSMAAPLDFNGHGDGAHHHEFVAELSAGTFSPTRWSSELAHSAPRPGIRFQPVPAFYVADVVLAANGGRAMQGGGNR